MKTEYKKTKLGLIPEDWELVTLSDIKAKERWSITGGPFGSNLKASDYIKSGGVRILQLQNIGDGRFIDSGNVRTSAKKADELLSCNIYPGEIIISKMGDPVARGCIVPDEEDRYLMASDGIRLKVNAEEWNNLYVLSLLNSDKVRSFAQRWSIGSTRQRIGLDDLKKLPFCKPPLPEQLRIADCLSQWDRGIALLERLIAQKEEQKKGLMQQLLTGRQRLPGFAGEWERVKLGKCFRERKETKRSDLPLLSLGESGVYPQSESNKKDTSNSDKSKYKRICVGDIGYNTMRMWQGRSALSNLEGIVSPAYTIIVAKENMEVEFFAYLFKMPDVVHKFFRNSQGLVRDTLNCKFKDFSTVKVFIPPTQAEQKAIAAVLNTADRELSLLGAKLGQYRLQKRGLMQQLLMGRKRLV